MFSLKTLDKQDLTELMQGTQTMGYWNHQLTSQQEIKITDSTEHSIG